MAEKAEIDFTYTAEVQQGSSVIKQCASRKRNPSRPFDGASLP